MSNLIKLFPQAFGKSLSKGTRASALEKFKSKFDGTFPKFRKLWDPRVRGDQSRRVLRASPLERGITKTEMGKASQDNLIHEYLRAVSTIRSYVEEQMDMGFTYLPVASASGKSRVESKTRAPNPQSIAYESMEDVRTAVQSCRNCSLHARRTNAVFGTGNDKAKLVFVGEAPGADEDEQGQPFVGAAGQKLTQIIEAMGLSRPEVYITNVLKCRPPDNRNPLPEEIKACEPFLIAQLRIIKPRLICALGTFAAQTLLRTNQRISSLRGRFHSYQGIKLMPTYHPAFLLRNQKFKRDVWEDVKKVKAEYDRE